MKINKICAGIVLYNPNVERLNDNINSLLSQVNKVVLVDNNSSNIEQISHMYKNKENIFIIKNNENKGIAFALNQIIDWANSNFFEWCLTMDQDSIPSIDMVVNMVKVYSQITVSNIGILIPVVTDMNLGELIENKSEYTIITNSTDAITSGSLLNLNVAKRIGGFNEDYFIDYVDTEFQERVLNEGYKIVRINTSVLNHEVGHMMIKQFFGFKFYCSNHSAFRRYYQVRNRLAFRKKYYGNLAYIKEKCRLILGTFKIIMFEKQKKEKVLATFRGFQDYKNLK